MTGVQTCALPIFVSQICVSHDVFKFHIWVQFSAAKMMFGIWPKNKYRAFFQISLNCGPAVKQLLKNNYLDLRYLQGLCYDLFKPRAEDSNKLNMYKIISRVLSIGRCLSQTLTSKKQHMKLILIFFGIFVLFFLKIFFLSKISFEVIFICVNLELPQHRGWILMQTAFFI